jgi:hypothetical protein
MRPEYKLAGGPSTGPACRATAPRPTHRTERTCHGLRPLPLAQAYFTNRSRILPRTRSTASLGPPDDSTAAAEKKEWQRERHCGWGNIGRDSARMVSSLAGQEGEASGSSDVQIPVFCPLRLADSPRLMGCWMPMLELGCD